MLFSSTSVGNQKKPNQPQVHSHMETIQKKVLQISPIIILLLCTLFSMRCNCRSIIPSGIVFTARASSVQVMLAVACSVFHFTCIFTIGFLMFPHMFVFFHICLHQISYLHRVDLSTFAVADLQGIRKGIQSINSITAVQAGNRQIIQKP